MEITHTQLQELFSQHCTCRPLDVERTDHKAACNTEVLSDIQYALGIRWFNDIGRIQAMREARERCAKIFHAPPGKHPDAE